MPVIVSLKIPLAFRSSIRACIVWNRFELKVNDELKLLRCFRIKIHHKNLGRVLKHPKIILNCSCVLKSINFVLILFNADFLAFFAIVHVKNAICRLKLSSATRQIRE
jgi:hypothetical protein